MAKFFSYYPKTFYISNNSTTGTDSVTNIISRFKFEESLKQNSTAFYPYQIQDGDTPEIIAHKYYNDPERHWIVLLFNDIVDPQFDWPLNQNSIIEYINKKYTANGSSNTTVQTGIAWALSENNVQSYFKVITTTANDGTITTEKLQVDANAYVNIASSTTSYTTQANEAITVAISKEKRSYYTYEIEENEKKREIKLLKKEFVSEVEKEFKRIISL
jgi:hypothetical protein